MKVARSPWLAGVLISLALACHAAETVRVWTFEADPLGQTAPGFSSHVGQWQVVAVDGGQALAQLAKNPDDVFNITLIDDTRAKDIDLKVDLRPSLAGWTRGAGWCRAADAKNYYLARYNPLEDNYRFYTVVAGKRTLLRDAKIDRTPGVQHPARHHARRPRRMLLRWPQGSGCHRCHLRRPWQNRPVDQGGRPIPVRQPLAHRRLSDAFPARKTTVRVNSRRSIERHSAIAPALTQPSMHTSSSPSM